MSRNSEYKPMNDVTMAGNNKETMSRLGRNAVKASCTTPEQSRAQRQRQMLQKIRNNLSEARYETTYETSETLLQMQDEVMKNMEGKMNNPGNKTEEEIAEECTKSASDTLKQMKDVMATKKQPNNESNLQRGHPASASATKIVRSLPSSSVRRTASDTNRSDVYMAVAEVHAVQDDD